jgi:heme o synthase
VNPETQAVTVEQTLPIEHVESRAHARRGTSTARHYYELTKPGITQMVVLTTLAGFYLAIPTDIVAFASSVQNWMLFLASLFGTVMVSAGACVYNHIVEREEDARMKRTASRPLPNGSVSVRSAAIFGLVLTMAGLALLSAVSALMVALAVTTWLSYVALYTPLKKRTAWALVVGGIPGALPFAAGWIALSGTIDAPSIALFTILFFWQLPHFLALSWMYKADYASGGFVMTAIGDETGRKVAWQLIVTSVLTLASAVVPTLLGMTEMLYVTGAVILGLWMVVESVLFLRRPDRRTARRVLLTSYAFLMGVIVLMIVDKASTTLTLTN